MRITDRIKNYLFYCGTTKEKYNEIKSELRDSNRKNLQVFSMIVAIIMAGLLVASFFSTYLAGNRPVYYVITPFFLIVFALVSIKKNNSIIVYTLVYIFIALLLGFGIVLGTVMNPDKLTVSFVVLMFAVPLLFIDIPVRMSSSIAIGMLAYILAAYKNQEAEIFSKNMSNVIPFGIASFMVCAYMMRIKTERQLLAVENRFLSEYDQMTGTLNRRSFDKRISNYKEGVFQGNYCVCIFDVNGLKAANDTLGHQAGDELIKGAASCIKNALGRYGSCYRIGGDEFAALLEGDLPETDKLRELVKKEISGWKGEFVSEVSVSIGMAKSDKAKDIDETFHSADNLMYADKAEYYRSKGIDRRSGRR